MTSTTRTLVLALGRPRWGLDQYHLLALALRRPRWSLDQYHLLAFALRRLRWDLDQYRLLAIVVLSESQRKNVLQQFADAAE